MKKKQQGHRSSIDSYISRTGTTSTTMRCGEGGECVNEEDWTLPGSTTTTTAETAAVEDATKEEERRSITAFVLNANDDEDESSCMNLDHDFIKALSGFPQGGAMLETLNRVTGRVSAIELNNDHQRRRRSSNSSLLVEVLRKHNSSPCPDLFGGTTDIDSSRCCRPAAASTRMSFKPHNSVSALDLAGEDFVDLSAYSLGDGSKSPHYLRNNSFSSRIGELKSRKQLPAGTTRGGSFLREFVGARWTTFSNNLGAISDVDDRLSVFSRNVETIQSQRESIVQDFVDARYDIFARNIHAMNSHVEQFTRNIETVGKMMTV